MGILFIYFEMIWAGKSILRWLASEHCYVYMYMPELSPYSLVNSGTGNKKDIEFSVIESNRG